MGKILFISVVKKRYLTPIKKKTSGDLRPVSVSNPSAVTTLYALSDNDVIYDYFYTASGLKKAGGSVHDGYFLLRTKDVDNFFKYGKKIFNLLLDVYSEYLNPEITYKGINAQDRKFLQDLISRNQLDYKVKNYIYRYFGLNPSEISFKFLLQLNNVMVNLAAYQIAFKSSDNRYLIKVK